MDSIYSPYKASHHQARIEQLRRGELIVPTQAQIDITNECNHRCPNCICRFYKKIGLNATYDTSMYIPIERIVKILDELKEVGVPSIEYTGGGEPQCHKDFSTILKETIARGFEWSLVTNGAMSNLSRDLEYFKKAKWIRISVDASSAKTHSIMHGTSTDDFDKVVQFVKTLVNECPNTIIGVSFLVSPLNYKEIINATEMFKDLGCSNMRFAVIYNPKGMKIYDRIWDKIVELMSKAKKLETEKFKVFDLIRLTSNDMITYKRYYSFCGYQHFTTIIGADQNVYPCCTLRYNEKASLGNLAEQSFKDILFGEKRRKWLKSNYLEDVCSNHSCLMDRKNEYIEYLVQENPPHVNYI